MSLNLRSAVSLTADKPDNKKPDDCEVQQGDIINSITSRYLVLGLMGQGYFGKVAQCVNLLTSEEVALKLIKSERSRDAEREITMLEAVSVLDPFKANVVQFFETFKHQGYTCLTFDLLDRSLCQLLKDRKFEPLSLDEIRPIAHQLLTAFHFLKGIQVVHSDLKLDNIMLVNHERQPFRVRLIDFGVSFKTYEDRRGMTIQALGYRAPEVHLGLPVSEKIDMWSLGCVLSNLYLCNYLFQGNCEYQLMRSIVTMLGQPADHLLRNGWYTKKFFTENTYWNYPEWWLKTPREYQLETGIRPTDPPQRSVSSLDDLVTFYPEGQESIEDLRAFVSLLKCLFQLDPERRITPREALRHPFFTMGHLNDEMDASLDVDDSFGKLMVCQTDDWEETPDRESEEPEDEGPPVILFSSAAGSVVSCSCDGIVNLPDGAAAAEDTMGSAEQVSAVSHGADNSGPAEDTLDTDGSPDQGAPIKVCQSRLKRIKTFFSRAIRAVFGRKN